MRAYTFVSNALLSTAVPIWLRDELCDIAIATDAISIFPPLSAAKRLLGYLRVSSILIISESEESVIRKLSLCVAENKVNNTYMTKITKKPQIIVDFFGIFF